MTEARAMLDLAACLAMRAAGYVEPNPMVGAVIVRDGRIIGMGHHLRFGGLHAEREALADCHRRGNDPRGATVYVTLEPCRHTGKQPPCTEALIEAGIARVICARPDPGGESGGGASVLRNAGIACEFSGESELATRISDPFVKRVTTGLPWVIAKWAQTIDGKIAARNRHREWISRGLMRRRVHRLRARVDAIMVGAGTFRWDDPILTARDVRLRRTARRIIVTGSWQLPSESAIARTVDIAPTTIIGPAPQTPKGQKALSNLRARGFDTCPISSPPGSPTFELRRTLEVLADRYAVGSVLVEGGAGLLGSLFDQGLVDQAIVHVAPLVLADHDAISASFGAPKGAISQAARLTLQRVKPVGDDIELVYGRAGAQKSRPD